MCREVQSSESKVQTNAKAQTSEPKGPRRIVSRLELVLLFEL
jgi:hypothetical protein